MKVTELKTLLLDNIEPYRGGPKWLLIELHTDEGLVGLGERVTGHSLNLRSQIELLHDLCDRFVIGQDPFNIEKIWQACYATLHDYRHPGMSHTPAISAIEMALWDIVGKATGQPSLQPARREVPRAAASLCLHAERRRLGGSAPGRPDRRDAGGRGEERLRRQYRSWRDWRVAAGLARHPGLQQLVDDHLDLGDAPGRANAGDKLLTLVASALAGGDCIDDSDALRAGGTARVLGCTVKAPSTRARSCAASAGHTFASSTA